MERTYLGREIDVQIDRYSHYVEVTFYDLFLWDGKYAQHFISQYKNVSLASLNRIVRLLDCWGVIWEGRDSALEYLHRMGV